MTDEPQTPSGDPQLVTANPGSVTGGPESATEPASDDGDEAGAAASQPRHRRKRRPLPWIVIILIAAVIAAVVRIFFVQTFFVPSVSMLPTLQVGDRMLVLKEGYSIQRGAIVVFRHPPADSGPNGCGPGNDDLVKRVIGLPGETIWSSGNTVYINGKVLYEPWLPKNDSMGAKAITKQKIAPNHYFMMGDNRAESCDSRYWGTLPGSLVVGRVFLIIWRHGHPVFDVI
jgi:signal peptidase I